MRWRALASMGLLSMGLGTLALPANCIQAPARPATPQERRFQQLSEQAEQAQKAGHTDAAIRLYFKALDIRPSWAEGWRNVGMLLADRKEFQRAEQAFRKLTSLEPKDGAGWALLGLCEYEQGHLDAAYHDIQRGHSLHIPNIGLDKVATYYAALILIQKGEFPIAQTLLTSLARQGADDADLITALGLAALRMETTPEKLDAAQAPLVNRVGAIEFKAIDRGVPSNTTLAGYQALLAERPDDSRLHYAYGAFLLKIGDNEHGLAEMRRTLELDPRDVMAALQLALNYARRDQPKEALPYAEKAVEMAPGIYVSHYALGVTLFRLGQTDRAVAELERAVKMRAESPEAHFALSEAYLRAHRKADAQREREIFARLKQQEELEAPSQAPPAPKQ